MQRSWPLFLVFALAIGGCSSSTGTDEVPQSRLVVGEFLYRSGLDTLEWIELRNDGAAPAPLAGVKIEAVGFEFPDTTAALPSGARLLLTNDAALFAARHHGTPIFGVFRGRLADEGEKLALERDGAELFAVRWSEREPWAQAAALDGASLVWTGGDPALPTSWAASQAVGGTPGLADQPATDPGVLVSEVRPASTDGKGFVEIWNMSAVAVDLGGWLLVDDAVVPESLAIAPGVVIPAGARSVFAQTVSAGAGSWGPLAPSRLGGRITLLKRGTGIAHSLEWSALPEGASWTRLGTWGTGILAVPTPGAGDVAVDPGPAYLSEICYNPSSGAEYVEIASLTDSVIHLGGADSALSWSLGGAGLRFRAGDSILPKGRLVVVMADEAAVPSFRVASGMPEGVPVVASAGRLDNAGERLSLGRPYLPATSGSGKLVWKERLVDKAEWVPVAPWPSAADGGGACLERVDPSLPGDSPLAWRAATPSAGR